jgi:hypothetical protein
MTGHGIGYLKPIYLKTKSMKKLTIFLWILLPSLLYGQAGEYFPKMPKKYEAPYPGMSTSVSGERGEFVWYVFAAKNEIPVYSDPNCENIKGREKYFQRFAVWQENEKAVRLVKRKSDAPLTDNYRFTANAVEAGWVKKEDLVLGESCLRIDGVWVRALIKKNPDNKSLPANMPGLTAKITDTVFNVYFVVKQEKDAWLLSVTDLVHEGFTNEDAFWVKLSGLTTIVSNRGYVPDWKKVIEGQKLYTFSDRSRTGISDTSRAAMRIYKNITHLGYFYINDDQKTAKVLNPLAIAADTQYINLSDARFLKANLIDNNQFTMLKEFAKILRDSPEKGLLKKELFNYFTGHTVDTNNLKIRSMNVAEMLGHTLGIDFSGYSASEITPVSELRDIDFESYYRTFTDIYDRLISEKEVDKYRFYSGLSYYWLPQNLLPLEILSKLTLFKPNKIVVKGGNFKEYSIFYIDHSAPASEKSYDQLQAEIKKLYMNLNKVWTAESQANDIGDLIYYSSGLDPIINSGSDGFELITGQMRNSSTIRPDRYYDKLRLENKLFSQIQVVSDKINIHFDVSDFFYQDELGGRAYFLKEFIERINQILATSNTQIFIYLYFNNSKSNSRESELQSFCKKITTLYPNVKFETVKM